MSNLMHCPSALELQVPKDSVNNNQKKHQKNSGVLELLTKMENRSALRIESSRPFTLICFLIPDEIGGLTIFVARATGDQTRSYKVLSLHI